jgi:hypothetical protein
MSATKKLMTKEVIKNNQGKKKKSLPTLNFIRVLKSRVSCG